MSNELKTSFIFESADADRRIDLTRKNLFALNNDFNNLGKNLTLSQSLGKQVKQSDSLMQTAQADIKRYQQQTLKGEQNLTQLLDRQAEQRFQSQTKYLQKSATEFQRALNQTERAAAASQKRSGFGGDVLGGLGVPIGVGAAVALGANSLKNAAGAAFDAERANRQLSASATQAGLSYQFLTEKAKGFADEGGLSQTNANRTEGLIAKLAQSVGRPQDLDKIETALLDTASSRGLQVSQLETLVNAVISGSSDEPLNAVGLSDPGKLAKDYADKLGKSTEALTKQEQVLSRFIPLMQQADTVTGANAERMQSLSGQAETAAARVEDLQTNVGKGITNSLEFRDALSLANDVLASMSVNISDVQKKLGQGFTPRQIAEQEAEKTGNKVVDFTKSALSFPFANVAYVVDLVTDGFEEANKKYLETLTGAKERRINALTGLFEGEKKVLEKQNKAAEKQKTFLNLQTFEDREKSRLEGEKKNLENRRKVFDSRFSNVSGLADIKQNRQLLGELNQNRDLFTPEEFAKRVYDTQKQINDEIEKGKNKVKDLGKTYTDVFSNLSARAGANNPFVAVISEGDKAVNDLKENLRGLPSEIQAVALAMQQKLNADALFETRIDNNLAAFDLRERANDLRRGGASKTPLKIEDPGKFFVDFVEAGLKQIAASNGGSLTRFNRVTNADGSFGGFSQSDARNDLLNVYERLAGGGTISRTRTFADLTEREKQSFVDSSTKSDVNLSLNDRLERQRSIIYDGAFTEDQKALADRKFLSLTSGVNSNELSASNRETLALTAERQAERTERSEREARLLGEKSLAVQEKIADEMTKLREIAERDGYGAIEQTLRVITEPDVRAELKPAATASDTKKAYRGGTFFDEYENQ